MTDTSELSNESSDTAFGVGKGKGKAISLQAGTDPEGSRRFEAPRFQDSRHMKEVRLSTVRTGRLYHPGNIAGTYFC